AAIRSDWEWLGFVTSGALVAVALLHVVLRSTGVTTVWHEARAVAEATKVLAWRYVMRTAPFDGIDERANDEKLLTELREILDRHPEVPTSTDRPQITPVMRELRSASPPERLEAYVRDRVTDQLEWYDQRAEHARRAAARCDACFYVFAAVA